MPQRNTAAMPRFAIFGDPVSHSLSPRLHHAFRHQTLLALEYEAIQTGISDLPTALNTFQQAGGVGANITSPLKAMAMSLCSELSVRAQAAGVVNTLHWIDSGWLGDNTDGVGLVRDLTERHGLDVRERRTLLLGAGGAAHGIVPAILDAGIGELTIVNRDSVRADLLADRIGQPGRVHTRYWDDLSELGEFDLIINATSAGRENGLQLPMSLVGPRSVAVDINYGEAAIRYLAWARAGGAHTVLDGLGMLVEQAAESFELWHDVRPNTDSIYAELRTHDPGLITAD